MEVSSLTLAFAFTVCLRLLRQKEVVSSKVACNTSREVQLLLCSLYLQCVPEVEDLKAGAY